MIPDADRALLFWHLDWYHSIVRHRLGADLAAQKGAIRQELVPAASDDLNGPRHERILAQRLMCVVRRCNWSPGGLRRQWYNTGCGGTAARARRPPPLDLSACLMRRCTRK